MWKHTVPHKSINHTQESTCGSLASGCLQSALLGYLLVSGACRQAVDSLTDGHHLSHSLSRGFIRWLERPVDLLCWE